MIKLLDMLAYKNGGPQPSYEYIAGQEYNNNPNQYCFVQKVSGQPQQQ